jgi:hypothetical protein
LQTGEEGQLLSLVDFVPDACVPCTVRAIYVPGEYGGRGVASLDLECFVRTVTVVLDSQKIELLKVFLQRMPNSSADARSGIGCGIGSGIGIKKDVGIGPNGQDRAAVQIVENYCPWVSGSAASSMFTSLPVVPSDMDGWDDEGEDYGDASFCEESQTL